MTVWIQSLLVKLKSDKINISQDNDLNIHLHYIAESCPAADLSTDLILDNSIYKDGGSVNYADATDSCNGEGGWLPTMENGQAFQETEILGSKSNAISSKKA